MKSLVYEYMSGDAAAVALAVKDARPYAEIRSDGIIPDAEMAGDGRIPQWNMEGTIHRKHLADENSGWYLVGVWECADTPERGTFTEWIGQAQFVTRDGTVVLPKWKSSGSVHSVSIGSTATGRSLTEPLDQAGVDAWSGDEANAFLEESEKYLDAEEIDILKAMVEARGTWPD